MSSSNDGTADPRMLSNNPDVGDSTHQSFFLDTISPDAGPSLLGGEESLVASRDIPVVEPWSVDGGTDTEAESSHTNTESTRTAHGQGDVHLAPQAMLVFIIGEHCVSDSCKVGVINDYPEASKTITSNACLDSSSFLAPVLQAMAELRLSMMLQVAVRLTAISLRLIAELLQGDHVSTQSGGSRDDEQRKLLQHVHCKLDQALPYYRWQGSRIYHGRAQYIAALLEEAIRVLAVPKEALTEALKRDAPASHAASRVVQSAHDHGWSPEDVCGVWAAETLLPAAAVDRRTPKSLDGKSMAPHFGNSGAAGEGRPNVHDKHLTADVGNPERGICHTRQYPSPDPSEGADGEAVSGSDSDDLPSPSTFLPRKPYLNAAKGRQSSEAAYDSATPGSRADNPMCIPNSNVDDEPALPPETHSSEVVPKPSRQSSRVEASKEIDYSTRHHPQDKDLSVMRRRKRVSQSTTEEGRVRAPPTKRRKVIKSSLLQ
ncbi:hypothetical protein KC336_g7942 [Hortaea werneckii]|nr:hypothetical protein KC336_g7942 [Hortaea werneckii]